MTPATKTRTEGDGMYKVVDQVSVSIPASIPEYIFQITLSDLAIYNLKNYYCLGLKFEKNKISFLKDLSDVLAAEILEKLMEIA